MKRVAFLLWVICFCFLWVFLFCSCKYKQDLSEVINSENGKSIDNEVNQYNLNYEHLLENNNPEEIIQLSMNYVPYEGDIYSFFVHPLITDKEKSVLTHSNKYIYDWFVTSSEFQNLLEELYTNTFILINT